MKIKRLDLPSWVLWDYKKHEFFESSDCLLGTNRYPSLKIEFLEFKPPFNKNGWYYYNGVSWFEIDNKLYLAGKSCDESVKSFKYQLNLLSYQPITRYEYEMLKKCLVYRHTQVLNKMVCDYANYVHYRDLKRQGLKVRKDLNLFRKTYSA